ncbi:MAG TPA: replication-relaxation family protein [Herpetosiphonaceae bacterium]
MIRALRITDRDLAILQSLADARYLTIEALEWLHFPHRRGAWEAAYQAQQLYKPTSLLYNRMKRMHEAKLVLRIQRPVALASSRFRREPDVYALAPDGATWLADATGIAASAMRADRLRERSFNTLAHGVGIGTFYAAMRTKVESMRVQFAEWQSDYALSKSYDRLTVRVTQANGAVKQQRMPVLPDGAFWIVHQDTRYLFFVEIDRGRHVSTWREKIMAYEAYVRSKELKARYGVESFTLLTATTTETQRQQLMQATAQINAKPGGRYLFTRISDLHPLTIGHAWQRINAATPTTGTVAGKPFTRMQVEAVPHVLLK